MKALLRFAFILTATVIVGLSLASPVLAKGNPKYAAFVMHADSGDVLFERYADDRRYPASLTKMMTLYLLFDEIEAGRLSLDSDLAVSARAAGQPPSKLGVTAGSTIDVETAIYALVVKSANDVAVVVAEGIAGSEWKFAQEMTEKARALGMRRTTFKNASGLPNSKQTTTARDLAILSQRLVQDHPHYFPYFAARDFTWNGKTYRTHNALVKTFDGADGLKTGYTQRSGFNLATSAKRGDNRLIGIVLGGRSVRTRDAHMRDILSASFTEIAKKPTLIAALYRDTPSPRIKPTLLAQLAANAPAAPTLSGNEDMRTQISMAAATFGADTATTDGISALIAAADSDDFNEYERVRLSAFSPEDENRGEGDIEDLPNWVVQIGAFSSKSMAQKELENAALAAELTAQERNVAPLTTLTGDTLYRARFTRLTEADASATCAKIKSRKLSCFVLEEPSGQ
ncbi:MAG: D-alanyl-D-alanine carboxypeptidase [Parvularculaceae bacterium]